MSKEKEQLPDQTWRDLTLEWSAEDRVWLAEKVPEGFRPVAARWGRALYQICMSAGMAQFILTTFAANVRHPQLTPMISNLAPIMDGLCRGALKGEGKTLKEFQECKTDLERVMALMDAGQRLPGDRVSKGGIVLDS